MWARNAKHSRELALTRFSPAAAASRAWPMVSGHRIGQLDGLDATRWKSRVTPAAGLPVWRSRASFPPRSGALTSMDFCLTGNLRSSDNTAHPPAEGRDPGPGHPGRADPADGADAVPAGRGHLRHEPADRLG